MAKKYLKKLAALMLTTAMVTPLLFNIKSYASDKIVDSFYILDEEGNPVVVEVTEKDQKDASREGQTYSVLASNEEAEEVMGEFDDLEEAALSFEENKSFFEEVSTYSSESGDVNVSLITEEGDIVATTEDVIGIVRFNRSKTTFNYTEVDTGRSGYLSPNTTADAAYIRTEADGVVCKVAGVTIKVALEDVASITGYQGQVVNRYYISSPYLIHSYGYYSGNSVTSSTLRVGYKPDYLEANKDYYSYDGHYFYDSFEKMIEDYRNNTYAHSVNPSTPYYNYYQYLSLRTKAVFTGKQYDDYVQATKPNSKSALKGAGDSFVNAQNIYTINSLVMLGISINETGWGTSSLALNKNNIFGLNAVDSDAYNSADTYPSVDTCIKYFAYVYMNNKYLKGTDYRYRGPHLGDKNSGLNVMYASDPFWGEKAASRGYYYDTAKADYGRYTLGIAKSGIIKLYKEASASSKAIYTSEIGNGGNLYDYPVVIQDTVKGTDGATYYKVTSDMTLKDDRSARNVEGQFMPTRDYVYAKADDIQIVFQGSGKDTVPVDPEKVTQLKPDLNPTPEEPETPTTPDQPTQPETPIVPAKTQEEVLKHMNVTNKDGYLTGFTLGGDVSAVKSKVTSLDSNIRVVVKNANGTEVSSGVLKTGMTIAITTGGSTSNYSVVVRGDVSGDGKISALDYVKVRNHLDAATTLSGAYLRSADASGDGKVSALDYVKVRNHLDQKSTIVQ